jgi:hypothetical protein
MPSHVLQEAQDGLTKPGCISPKYAKELEVTIKFEIDHHAGAVEEFLRGSCWMAMWALLVEGG